MVEGKVSLQLFYRRPEPPEPPEPPDYLSDSDQMSQWNSRGVDVAFPYASPYACQKVFVERLIEALQQRQNALLESPTGTGKVCKKHPPDLVRTPPIHYICADFVPSLWYPSMANQLQGCHGVLVVNICWAHRH